MTQATHLDPLQDSGLTASFYYDDCPNSPREWDGIGVIAADHPRYDLADPGAVRCGSAPVDFYRNLLESSGELETQLMEIQDAWDAEYNEKTEAIGAALHSQTWFKRERELRRELHARYAGTLRELALEHFVILPVYMYEHSGVALNTTGFHCPWDSGQVGWIYVSYKDLCTYGMDPKRAKEVLKGEIKTYSNYLNGSVYGYQVEDEVGDVVDSCWGFFNEDHLKLTALETLTHCAKERG